VIFCAFKYYTLKEVVDAINFSLSLNMDRYTRYYLNRSGGGEMSPVYMVSFRFQRGNGIGSFLRGLFRYVKHLLYSGANAVGKEALKTGSNTITDIIKTTGSAFWRYFQQSFGEAKDNLEETIRKWRGLAWVQKGSINQKRLSR
jgi:hypothetical protein